MPPLLGTRGSASAAALGFGSVGDPYFKDVVILLHGDGTNGSTTFTDFSRNALTVTAVGNAQVDTTTKKFGTGSMEFDGNGDYLTVSHTAEQVLGTDPFTIEMWVYRDTTELKAFIGKGVSGSTGWAVGMNSTAKAVFYYGSSSVASSGSISISTWTHIAVVREGTGSNQTKIYIDGTNDGTATVSTNFTQTETMYIGAGRGGNGQFDGFIDDLRITKNVARYTGNFTVPTRAFPDR